MGGGAAARLTDWGFNTLGVGCSPSVRYRGLAHLEMLDLGTDFAAWDPITPKTTWTGFPNVFSPKFAAFCDKEARKRCAPERDDPWLIGYFIDNELEWHSWTGKGLFADTFSKPAGNSAKQALLALLRRRHPTPADFNRAWGTAITDFAELAALTEAPLPSPRRRKRMSWPIYGWRRKSILPSPLPRSASTTRITWYSAAVSPGRRRISWISPAIIATWSVSTATAR